jgi:uncharacterized membrane protein
VLTESRARSDREGGSILPLVVGYTAIAAVLIAVGIDASKVFLARRALSAAADSAALAAAQGIDVRAVYDGSGIRCGDRLPLSGDRAAQLATAAVRDASPGLRRTFASLDTPRTSVSRDTVTVVLGGEVAVPFGRVLTWLDPDRTGGRVGVTDTSHAVSPVVGVAGC